jgi:hypothetical protein
LKLWMQAVTRANANSVGGEGRDTVNGMTVSAAQRRPFVVRR